MKKKLQGVGALVSTGAIAGALWKISESADSVRLIAWLAFAAFIAALALLFYAMHRFERSRDFRDGCIDLVHGPAETDSRAGIRDWLRTLAPLRRLARRRRTASGSAGAHSANNHRARPSVTETHWWPANRPVTWPEPRWAALEAPRYANKEVAAHLALI